MALASILLERERKLRKPVGIVDDPVVNRTGDHPHIKQPLSLSLGDIYFSHVQHVFASIQTLFAELT
jgi:hypothetical protein